MRLDRLLIVWTLVALATCAPIREDYVAQPSFAFDRPDTTPLGRAAATPQRDHAGQSGFRLLNNGVSALMTRAAMADHAEHSIDFQSFIVEGDEVGAFVIEHLLTAARRGVRVRILLDDFELGLDDRILARLDAEPNVEVRLFNPFPDRSRWSRPLQLAFGLDRLGRRMHNKVFVADGQAALLGGRNISNLYFETSAESNFRDIELQVAGPVATEAGRSFDTFWNSAMVIPVKALGLDGKTAEAAAMLDRLLDLNGAEVGPAAEYRARSAEFSHRILDPANLIWASAHVIAEPPVRQAEGAAKPSAEIARAHAIARQQAMREVIYESAYFVPGDRGVQVLGDLTRRDVKVTVLTNSLASTDEVAVHASYALYRPALLAAGVHLHEYRIDASRPEPIGHHLHLGHSDSALHAKIVIYDRHLVWVGSANFDPRSRNLNTEIGVMIESEDLARVLLAGIERDFAPSQSWRVELAPGQVPGQLVWIGERDGQDVRLDSEPDTNPWRGLKALFYTALPGIEELL